MQCVFCNKEAKSKQSKIQHELRCKHNPAGPAVKPSYGMLGKKGRNQYTNATVTEISNETRKKMSESHKGYKWSDERRLQHSNTMKRAVLDNPESYSSSNRGRTKQVTIDGIKLQGKWEVDFYNWAKAQGLQPQRPTSGFPYTWNGERTYFPDFYIPDLCLYVEVKGYETDRDRAKWSYFPEKLRIIKEHEIKQIRKNTFTGL